MKMEMIRALIVCNAGASSGFLAKSIKKSAQKMGVKIAIKARSETELLNLVDEIDILLVAPHLADNIEDYSEIANPYGVKVFSINPEHYGILDGESIVKEILGVLKQ